MASKKASEQTSPPQKSSAIKGVIIAALTIAIILTSILVLNKIKANKRIQEVQSLLSEASSPTAKRIPTTKTQIELLLSVASSTEKHENRPLLYRRLALAESSDDANLNELFAEHAMGEFCPNETRKQLFQVLQQRQPQDTQIIKDLMAWSVENLNHEATPKALRVMPSVLKYQDFQPTLNLLTSTTNQNVRNAAENNALAIVKTTKRKREITRELKKQLTKSPNQHAKEALLRILISSGEDEARNTISEILKGKDKNLRTSILAGLQHWPDDSLYELLLTNISEKRGYEKTAALESAFATLKKETSRDPKETQAMWQQLFNSISEPKNKLQLINKLALKSEPWAESLLKQYEDDNDGSVSKKATSALEYIERKKAKKK